MARRKIREGEATFGREFLLRKVQAAQKVVADLETLSIQARDKWWRGMRRYWMGQVRTWQAALDDYDNGNLQPGDESAGECPQERAGGSA